MLNLFSDLPNLNDLSIEEKKGIMTLLQESLKLTKENEEYNKYIIDCGNLSMQEWKEPMRSS